MAYRILSLDGGGIRGVLTAQLLVKLEAARPGFLKSVDLLTGTSTGGIIALCLSSGMSPVETVELYSKNGAYIFDDSWLRDLEDVGGIIGADYRNTHLADLLKKHLGDKTLAELDKKVAITSFDTHPVEGDRSWKPKIFHNFPGPDSDGAELCHDVGMRTSAAPTYFPMFQHYIDGGVFANNPSMVGVGQALDSRAAAKPLSELAVFSLGTGESPSHIEGENHNWGKAQWARPLIGILIDGVMGIADFQCRQLLGDRYKRLNPALGRNIRLDDWHQVPYLLKVANDAILTPYLEWIDRNW